MGCTLDYDTADFFYLQAILGSLSILGCLFIIVSYLWLSKFKMYSYRIISYLSLSVLSLSTQFLIPPHIYKQYYYLCSVYGFITNSSAVNSFIWVTCMAVTLYNVIVKSDFNYEKYEKYWISACFIASIINTIPLITDNYGLSQVLCTYKTDIIGNIMRYLFFYAPAWVLIGITVFCYVKVFKKMNAMMLQSDFKVLIQSLFFYPIVLIANVLILSIYRFVELFVGNCQIGIFYLISYYLLAATGLLITLIFLLTASIKHIREPCIINTRKTAEINRYSGASSVNLLEIEID